MFFVLHICFPVQSLTLRARIRKRKAWPFEHQLIPYDFPFHSYRMDYLQGGIARISAFPA